VLHLANAALPESEHFVDDSVAGAKNGSAALIRSTPAARHRVVVLGGGTGSFTVLSGLRPLAVDLTSIVSVMDSGGSSGRLRDEYGFLPPGDARQCLVALANDDESAHMLRTLFSYRFGGGRSYKATGNMGSLDGHSLGNLFISALTDITGSVEVGYDWAARLLGARGRVIPVTTSNVDVCARLTDGHVLRNEAAIDVRIEHPDVEIDYIYLDRPAYPTHSATEALRAAELIVIGPGDLYTSVIPNLLVDGIVEAIAEARNRVFVVNLMTKRGETDGFRASTFVERLKEYLGPAVLDAAVINTAQPTPKVGLRYAAEGAYPVEADIDAVEALGVRAVARPLASSRYFMRHDPNALADTLLEWLDARMGGDAEQPVSAPDAAPNGAVVTRSRLSKDSVRWGS
jgi:uncharacterized cofD-like protein